MNACNMELEPCLLKEKKQNIHISKRRCIRMDGPDGCTAWCVAFSACLINFIMAGLGRMSGIAYIAFMDRFQTDRKTAATPFSVRSSARCLLGPAVGILGQKYGVRAVTVSGGIIGTLGAAACFYAPNMLAITLLWGGINGFGTALTTTLPQVVIEQYFKKHKTTALGMAFSGGCVGSFLFPVLIEQLLQTYGLEGTFLIIAGIVMHCIPAAMILKEPSWSKKQKTSSSANLLTTHDNSGSFKSAIENHCNVCKCSTKSTKSIDFEYLRLNADTVVQLLNLDLFSKHTHPRLFASNVNRKDVCTCEITDVLKDIERFYLFHDPNFKPEDFLELTSKSNVRNRLAVAEVKCRKSQSFHLDVKPEKFQTCENLSTPDISKLNEDPLNPCFLTKIQDLCNTSEIKILSYFSEQMRDEVASVLNELKKIMEVICLGDDSRLLTGSFYDISGETLEPVNVVEKNNNVQQISCDHPNTFLCHIKTAFKLHKNPLFLLICLCRASHFITFVPVVMIIVDFSIDQGLTEDDGKYVIAALSLGDLLGRLCLGWITDYGYVSLPRYMMVVMVLQGASTASLPIMNSKVTLMTTLALFGMLQGSVFIRQPVCLYRYLKSHEQSIATGCINFFAGILGFMLPLYIGYFRDTIGSYNCIFYINGSIGSLVGLIWIFEPHLAKKYISRNQDVPEVV